MSLNTIQYIYIHAYIYIYIHTHRDRLCRYSIYVQVTCIVKYMPFVHAFPFVKSASLCRRLAGFRTQDRLPSSTVTRGGRSAIEAGPKIRGDLRRIRRKLVWGVNYCLFIWANYNDLTATSLESWITRGIIPKWPYFRLVNYYNLPRFMVS